MRFLSMGTILNVVHIIQFVHVFSFSHLPDCSFWDKNTNSKVGEKINEIPAFDLSRTFAAAHSGEAHRESRQNAAPPENTEDTSLKKTAEGMQEKSYD